MAKLPTYLLRTTWLCLSKPSNNLNLGQGGMALQQSMQQAAAAAAGHGPHGGANAGMLGSPFSAHAAAMQLGLTNPAFAAAYNQPGLGSGQVTGAGTLTPAGKLHVI